MRQWWCGVKVHMAAIVVNKGTPPPTTVIRQYAPPPSGDDDDSRVRLPSPRRQVSDQCRRILLLPECSDQRFRDWFGAFYANSSWGCVARDVQAVMPLRWRN
jgi:hypothetical protein